jgi:hypothetical protein
MIPICHLSLDLELWWAVSLFVYLMVLNATFNNSSVNWLMKYWMQTMDWKSTSNLLQSRLHQIMEVTSWFLKLESKEWFYNFWIVLMYFLLFLAVSLFVYLMVLNATFNNSSAVISWLSVLMMEETREPRQKHRPVASHWQTLSHNVVQLALIEIRTHNISCDLHWLHRQL